MDNNPGDSSSESEISDPWSLVDRDSCDENSGVNSGVGSVCGELSDGESLEVIDEEDQHEVPETGVDTDGVSIITDSEINEELDQTLPAALSKEKKYLHHPNTCLNTRLNVLLALSFAAVTGLGLGHFLGLQEECPALDTSLTAQIAKLQQENEFLQHKLNQLLLERPLHFNHENIDNLEYGSEKNELELEAKELSSKQFNEHIESEPFTEFDHEKLTQVSPGAFLKILQNDIELVENDNGNILEESKENDIGNTIMVDEKESIIRDTLLEEYSFDDNKEDVIEPSDSISYLDGQILISNGKEADSYTEDLQHGLGLEEMVNDIVDIRNTYEDVEKNYINLGENIVNVNLEKNNLNEDDNVIDGNIQEVDSDSSFIIKGEENFVGTSSVDSEKIIYDLNSEDSIISEVHVDDVNTHQQNHVHTKILDNAVNEEYTLDENNIQIIKSTLELLKLHFDKDIISIDTESILSSAVALAIEHETEFDSSSEYNH
ncbi:hypothetical protein L9F63_026599 [Diploptera punctata]|uniref:Uncharacterized protein n=1 Tax=Diploptera punctata TaxID=6984 RepID=A0AAD8AGU3_DIPPU|nr:hypothetical protein L9F63_026599 [Diploptera punctata]